MNANDASPNAAPEKQALHPNLQAALSSLNVNLEEELNRFRQEQNQRQEITLSSPPPPPPSPPLQSSLVRGTQETPESDVPQDYLASSEELLRSLEELEEWEVSPPPQETTPTQETESTQKNAPSPTFSWRSYLLTPLGVAGIAIFFLSGILLSMMLINLGQNRFSTSDPSDPSAPNKQTPASPETESPQEQTTESNEESASVSIPNRPDLTKDEFIELDVENLVEAEPQDEVPVAEKPSCGGNFYCVMVENPDETQYQRTRQFAPDSYLREFPGVGQVLQVGAFDRESRAQELQQQLEAQGIASVIYDP